jgi:hypothetical protein
VQQLTQINTSGPLNKNPQFGVKWSFFSRPLIRGGFSFCREDLTFTDFCLTLSTLGSYPQGLPRQGLVDCIKRCMVSGRNSGSDVSDSFGSSGSGSSGGANYCHTQLSPTDPLMKYAESYCQTYDDQIDCNKVHSFTLELLLQCAPDMRVTHSVEILVPSAIGSLDPVLYTAKHSFHTQIRSSSTPKVSAT